MANHLHHLPPAFFVAFLPIQLDRTMQVIPHYYFVYFLLEPVLGGELVAALQDKYDALDATVGAKRDTAQATRDRIAQQEARIVAMEAAAVATRRRHCPRTAGRAPRRRACVVVDGAGGRRCPRGPTRRARQWRRLKS